MDKMLTTATLLLFICFTGIPQATYQGLTPGQSTRADVERLLGQPVNKIGQTLHEYGPKWTARKIYVQYGNASAVVDRIEVLLDDPVSPSDARMYFRIAAPPGEPFGGNSPYRSESLRRELLSLRPVATRTHKGKLEEYFSEPFYTVLTHEGEEASSRVSQIGYYSRELFEAAIADVRRDAGDATTQGGKAGLIGCFKDSNNPFDLDGFLEPSSSNTPERCVATCRAKGFKYAGVQNGQSCLCGNSYGNQGAASNCNMKCTGDPGKICGGHNANSVYLTGAGGRPQ